MCLEAALELSEPLLSGGDGPRPGAPLGSQPARAAEVVTAEQAVAAAREVALGLVCTRMPRPPAALVWVADEEDDSDVELEEEAGSSSSQHGAQAGQPQAGRADEGGEEGDAYRTAQAALLG